MPQVSPHESGRKARAVHLLNRIGFGARPADVDAVLSRGIEHTLEEQLYPEDIDDRELDERLPRLPLLSASTQELLAGYNRVGPGPILAQLEAGRLLRVSSSRRQLYELMVDFWFNHFNVHGPKGFVGFYIPEYEREVIRPHALGRFRTLLGGVARHPAMLYYLDNWLSAAPGALVRDECDEIFEGGINENYSRELLELHTLGVDGGYTQEDVIEIARALTGWTIDHPRQSGRFQFNAAMHEPGEKTVLGRRIAGAGLDEGERVLDLVVSHPSTAQFVSFRLCQRFLADDPPPRAVARGASIFRSTGGDIRRVVASILQGEELMDPASFGAKPKTPLELVASALRAVDARIDDASATARALEDMGMPLYQSGPPTGYPNDGRQWMNVSSLLSRVNFAMELASGRVAGVVPRLERLLGDADRRDPLAVAAKVAEKTFGYRLSSATWEAATAWPGSAVAVDAWVVGLFLASPDFQRK
jgi:uncharacterized protein (DUF1800 family)